MPNRADPVLALLSSLIVLGLSLWSPLAAQPSAPGIRLMIEAPEPLAGVAARLERFDTARLTPIVTLVGSPATETPIRVRLEAEGSPVALATPSWVAGFVGSGSDRVVLFPDRIGSYPFRLLESVLHHEIAHVLIDRAVQGEPVPRWFHEGLASAAERTQGLETRSRLTWELLVRQGTTATELERLFGSDGSSVARAYVLSDALVRDLLSRYGWRAPSRILSRVRRGEPFELALLNVTGLTVRELVEGFWIRHATWKRWVAFAGHPATAWLTMTALALVAIWRHRRRRARQRRLWELEERAEEEAWEEHRRRYHVH